MTTARYRIVDLFAGPGGLAEGFSSLVEERSNRRLFDVVLSVEKEASAHRTLTLRAFTRQFAVGRLPDAYYAFAHTAANARNTGDVAAALERLKRSHPAEWSAAEAEARLVELGTPQGNSEMDRRMDALLSEATGEELIVVGGPPCQAYSLVGRSRNRGVEGYRAEDDGRHFLYREYIRILDTLRPAAFVMENVKGMISSSVSGRRVFDQVRADLERAGGPDVGYRLVALDPKTGDELPLDDRIRNSDFIIRAEDNGVPQARHRVIIVGIRGDLCRGIASDVLRVGLPFAGVTRTVRDVIGMMAPLRSGLSRGDSEEAWREATTHAMETVVEALANAPAGTPAARAYERAFQHLLRFRAANRLPLRHDAERADVPANLDELHDFLTDPRLAALSGHESRGHMPSDLARYFFCSVFAEANGRPPKAREFPDPLAPEHRNWRSGKFADRFRTQLWDAPATTVVSHIAKDGHYFIHPDPMQCRSLTVREAARLQTFPDNYIFLGNRTEQFVQVGNAVPPFLAQQIATSLYQLLEKCRTERARKAA